MAWRTPGSPGNPTVATSSNERQTRSIAEGLAYRSAAMRNKHLHIAMGSAAECQAVLDLLRIKGHTTAPGLALLSRIGAMLSRLLH